MDAEETTTEENTTKSDTEVVPVTAPGGSSDEQVNKALESVAAMVENIAKAAGVKLTTPEVEETTKNANGEEQNVDKAGFNPREQFGKQLKANGIKGDAFTKAMAGFDKAFKPFQPGAATQPPEKKTTKSADESEATVEDVDKSMEALELLEAAITKAKRFTPKREAAFKAALATLTKLLGEMQNIKPGASPATTVPGGASFGASGVQTLTKAIDELTAVVTKSVETGEANAKRIEDIEKSRTPSETITEDGETDNKETTKSFWAGIL